MTSSSDQAKTCSTCEYLTARGGGQAITAVAVVLEKTRMQSITCSRKTGHIKQDRKRSHSEDQFQSLGGAVYQVKSVEGIPLGKTMFEQRTGDTERQIRAVKDWMAGSGIEVSCVIELKPSSEHKVEERGCWQEKMGWHPPIRFHLAPEHPSSCHRTSKINHCYSMLLR